MKKHRMQIATSGCLVLAALSIGLVVSMVSCKTAVTPEQSAAATNTGPVAAEAHQADGHYYTCAMHPTVRSLDPAGKCPFCGMDLLPAETVDVVDPASGKTNTAATFPAVSGYYSCPMHPTVLSTNADDKCPICGMALVPVESPVFIRIK